MNGYQLATGVFAVAALGGELWYEGVPQSLVGAIQNPAGGNDQYRPVGPGNPKVGQGPTNFTAVLQTTWGQLLVFSAVFIFLELLAAEDGTSGQIATTLAFALFVLFMIHHGPDLSSFFNTAWGGIK